MRRRALRCLVACAALAGAASAAAAADGVIVRQKTVIAVDAAGRVTREVDSAIQPLGPWATARFFDPSLDWNDARSELKVRAARTTTPTGRVVEALANSLVPNTSFALERAVPYAHMRQLTISQVGVETGAVTELAYTVADRAPSGVPLWGVLPLDAALPVTEQEVVVRAAPGIPLRVATTCADARGETTTGADGTSYVLRRRDVPPLNFAEVGGPHGGPCHLAYSGARDWAEVRAFIEARVERAAVPSAALRERAAKLAPAGLADEERIAALHRFVALGIDTVRWPLVAFDYAARPADEVLASSVGHALDKAVLLAALLRAAGFEAKVALVSTDARPLPEVPSPALLDEAWVRVAAEPEWLDPLATADRDPRDRLAGRTALVLDGAAAAPVAFPELSPATNRAVLHLALKLADKGHEYGVTGSADLDLLGLYNSGAPFDRAQDQLSQPAAAAAAGFGKPRVAATTIARKEPRRSALRVTLDGGVLAKPKAGAPLRLVLPRVPSAIECEPLQLHRNRRSLPLILPAAASERVEVKLELPADAEVLYTPAPVTLENPAGRFVREVAREGNTLTVTSTLTLPRRVVAPQDYPALRTLFAALEAEAGRTILIR